MLMMMTMMMTINKLGDYDHGDNIAQFSFRR